MEIVIEDIERIDFTKYDDDDTKLSSWSFEFEEDYAMMRNK